MIQAMEQDLTSACWQEKWVMKLMIRLYSQIMSYKNASNTGRNLLDLCCQPMVTANLKTVEMTFSSDIYQVTDNRALCLTL